MTDREKNRLFKALDLKQRMDGASFGGDWHASSGHWVEVRSPTDGRVLGRIRPASVSDLNRVLQKADQAFRFWREVPAPRRGEIVRQIGVAFRERKEWLGRLVSLEMGKILTEALGEIQEMIDICDFAAGLGRTFSGPTLQSERPQHRMMEQWHPLGVVGVISAFNFPVAVWSWNAALAWVCGNSVVWKPSSKTPLAAIACQNVVREIFSRNGVPEGVSGLAVGEGRTIGERLVSDRRVALVSATGSTAMGRRVGEIVGKRLGRAVLELGGNNALIVSETANLEQALAAVFFGAVGTAGQRCTSTRRLIVHRKVYRRFLDRLVGVYKRVRIGDPLNPRTIMGPLVDESGVAAYKDAVLGAQEQGGRVLCGGKVLRAKYGRKTFVEPTIIEMPIRAPILKTETFAPILYALKCRSLAQAIAIQNDVPQGLSSSVFTSSLSEAERFVSCLGSDCGIANVNVGTSGAEIGGAFGGEKDTGGGRESGSDAWKSYMRRQTNTINWGGGVHLAQGVDFAI